MRNLWKKFTSYFVPSEHNAYRPHLLAKPWLVFFLTIVLTTEGVLVASLIADHAISELPAAVVPAQVVAFTNVERARSDENLLRENSLLDFAAQAKANDMASRGYFSHTGPDGKVPWAWIEESGYRYQYAGENLAVRFDDSANVVNAWMASPTHRANIVKPIYQEIGVGVADGVYEGSSATFVVQYFGTPLAALTSVTPVASNVVEDTTEPPTQVQGASIAQVSPTPTTSTVASPPPTSIEEPQPHDTVTQQVARIVTDSKSGVPWVLGGMATLLLVLLALAFFIHIEIQSHEMILGGGLVATTALLFLALNFKLPDLDRGANQAASVANVHASVLVGEDAATTESPAFSLPFVPLQTPPIAPSE